MLPCSALAHGRRRGWSGRACLHAYGWLETEQTSGVWTCLLPKSHLLFHSGASPRPCPPAKYGCEGPLQALIHQAVEATKGGHGSHAPNMRLLPLPPSFPLRTALLPLLYRDSQCCGFVGQNGLHPVPPAKQQPGNKQEQDLLVRPTVPLMQRTAS